MRQWRTGSGTPCARPPEDEALDEISWGELFAKFDERELAFLYQDQKAGGEERRFSDMSGDRRKMSESPYRETDWTEWDAEGIPDLEEQPPGIDAETAEEGAFPARDEPLGSLEWGTTAREQLIGEPLDERVAHEVPEPKPEPPD